MGYTHYATIEPLTRLEWTGFTQAVHRIATSSIIRGIGHIVFQRDERGWTRSIAVMGLNDDETCEVLDLNRDELLGEQLANPNPMIPRGHVFVFVKTRRLQYDALVLAVLFALSDCTKHRVTLSSDAQSIQELHEGIEIYTRVFGNKDAVAKMARGMLGES